MVRKIEEADNGGPMTPRTSTSLYADGQTIPDISTLLRIGHFYFAKNRTFLLCVDTCGSFSCNTSLLVLINKRGWVQNIVLH